MCLVLASAIAFVHLGGGQPPFPLVGTWAFDVQASEQYPGNAHIPKEELDSITWLWGIQIEEQFQYEDHTTYRHWTRVHPEARDRRWTVVDYDIDGSTIKVRLQSGHERDSIESEYVAIGGNTLAKSAEHPDGFKYWKLYSRAQ